MSLPHVPEIARMFALAIPYTKFPPEWPYFATPKLDGIRAMWIPKVGFISRDGIPWEPGVLPHLEAALKSMHLWLDGELYIHGAKLQEINSLVAINRKKPAVGVERVQFHVFDAPHIPEGFEARQQCIAKYIKGAPELVSLPFKYCACGNKGNAAFEAYVSAGYEGAVYKHSGSYYPGRTKMMIKRKAWIDDDFDVVRLIRGEEGKHDHSMGAVVCKTTTGLEFEVGSFTFNDKMRLEIFCGPTPTRAKIRYRTLTEDGRPFHAQVLCMY